MKLYRVDVVVHATAYIKAENEKDACAITIDQFDGVGVTLAGNLVSELAYSDPALPNASLSPAGTIQAGRHAYVEEVDD